MLQELQKRTAQAIINIFETSKVSGDYAKVVFFADDPGGLTYGKSQTTLMSGNLFLLIKAYCETENAQFADELRPYLKRLELKDTSLNKDMALRTLLREAGSSDPVMWEAQDEFFDRVYWNPAVQSANKIGIFTALGVAVVYDSIVHGSWVKRRDETIASYGKADAIGEKEWIKCYVQVRRKWLANHPNRILPLTVYRMDALKKIIDEDNWDLSLPLKVRGITISEDLLGVAFPSSARLTFPRLLRLSLPYLQGEDVRQVQQALTDKGFKLELIDGIFGPATDAAVKKFQKANNLKVDGIVGSATLLALGLDT
jgi:chitosanase